MAYSCTMRGRNVSTLILPLVLSACGGSGGGREAGGGVSGLTTMGGLTDTATAGASTAATSASATQGSASATGTSAGDEGPGVKFDVSYPLDVELDCNAGDMMTAFSYIWIANSPQGTVSKIDTKTGVELGRYYSHPNQGAGDPSRTSVNLLGDVAVSNRAPGQVTKIAAELSRCVDKNNDNVIQTSTGPGDVLPWGQDECVLWSVSIPSPTYNYGPRPTAWDPGTYDEKTCTFVEQPRLWIGFKNAAGFGEFWRLDGETGAVLDQVTGPAWGGSNYGPYGGAVNAEGDFIVTGVSSGQVIHIDAETLQVTEIPGAPGDKYGMGLDADGNLWVGGYGGHVHNFDFATMTWTTIPTMGTSVRGIMVDRDGFAWGAGSSPCALVKVDVATKTLVDGSIPLPGCVAPWGVSIDVDGFVWVVDRGAHRAFKVDPVTHQVALEATGLVSPYTYSDMTGAGLNLVVNPPG